MFLITNLQIEKITDEPGTRMFTFDKSTNKQAVKIEPWFQSNFLSSEIWLKCISDNEEMLFNYFFLL